MILTVVAWVTTSCGSTATTTSDPTSTRPATTIAATTTPPTWLGGFVDHSLDAAVFVPAGDGALVYGGSSSTDGAVNRNGVFLDSDGTYRSFTTPTGLVDATAIATDTHAYLAGRSCTGKADRTDTGVACAPGKVTVFEVDRATGRVAQLDLGTTITDATGREGFATPYLFGDRVVVDASGPDTHVLIAFDRAGKRTTLTLPGGNLVCSTGDALFAEAAAPAATPEHEVLPDDGAAAPAKPGIVALSVGATTWKPVADPPTAPGGIRDCSKGHFFELPAMGGGSRRVATYDVTTGKWTATPELGDETAAYALTNPDLASFVVVGGTSTLVDPSSGELHTITPTPTAGGPSRILLRDGSVASIGSDLHLESTR